MTIRVPLARRSPAVDGYINAQPTASRRVLRHVRRLVREALPDAEEVISYRIPAYRLHGRVVVYFAGWAEHWSIYPVTERVKQAVGSALLPYAVSKGTVRFPLSDPIPEKLVARIVKALAQRAQATKIVARGRRKSPV